MHTIKAKRIEECECTCHVYGQTHKHQTRLVLFTRGSETPMHLPRLWTDAPVATQTKTQVNNTAIKLGRPEKRSHKWVQTGAKRAQPSGHGGPKRKNKQARRQRGGKEGATLGVEERKKWVMSDSVEYIQDGGVCPLGECHSSYSRWQRRPGSLLRFLQPSDIRRCMQLRTQRCQDPVLFCVVSDLGRLALAHAVAKSVPAHSKLVVGTILGWQA